ncbi:MAG: C-terminal binding protein [Dehalococcoidia bacterium]
MAKKKVVILGIEDDPLQYERAEMEDLDVEFIQVKPDSEGEAMEAVKDADAVMMRGNWGTEQVIKATEHCQVLAVYSHGFNHIDVDACTEKGIILTNGAGMCAEEVSNQGVAFLLALNRQVVQTTNRLRKDGSWDRSAYLPIGALDEQVLGIVGFGNIGRQVARKMSGWRMRTLVYDPYIAPWIIKEYGVEQVHELNDLCSRADYVVVVVPLNRETYHMIGEEQFRAMKDTAFFINVCRGSVTDEAALIKALQTGQIRGAGLDVFEQEPVDPKNLLLQMENVITAPHIAGNSTRSAWLSRERAAQQVAAVLRGEWPMAGQNPEVTASIPARKRAKARQPQVVV